LNRRRPQAASPEPILPGGPPAPACPDPEALLAVYYPRGSRAFELLCRHGEQVAAKALEAAARVARLDPDTRFIYEAARLHDIGICGTHSPELGCFGPHPYICHGVLGRELLEQAGLPRHALVCERHVGLGLSAAEIETQKLPLPPRDMRPVSIEEQIVCYADKFYSKKGGRPQARSLPQVIAALQRRGGDLEARFQRWAALFETPAPECTPCGSRT
jgi:uncharacterized protein